MQTCLAALLTAFGLAACVSGAAAQEVNASKPTNFHPLLDNSLEYNSRQAGGDLMGYRALAGPSARGCDG